LETTTPFSFRISRGRNSNPALHSWKNLRLSQVLRTFGVGPPRAPTIYLASLQAAIWSSSGWPRRTIVTSRSEGNSGTISLSISFGIPVIKATFGFAIVTS